MKGKGYSFVVASLINKRVDYDWCGSIGQALKRRDARIATGEYRRVLVQRLRLTKGRKRGSRRILYASGPVATWQAPVALPLAKAA
ncbi:MAG TPA: hypothetical protein VG297_06195 [Bryobacteraceae bacterium]|jgi:hypothetical protein|nr:hypothetical protein [Bryobacteraceae bacterium]